MESDFSRLADALLNLLESDRARIAHALGDEVLSLITMARYLTEDAARRLARGEVERVPIELQGSGARIREAEHRLLALCSELRPRVLDDLGLLAALSAHLRDFSRQNRAIFISPRMTVPEGSLPAGLKLVIFRIVQAALSNVARHSKASAVRVFLSMFEDELRLVIEDNGVGFDLERWRQRRYAEEGCGLDLIERWVQSSRGRCDIDARPRHGVKIQVIWIPASPAPASIEGAAAKAALNLFERPSLRSEGR